MSAMTLTASSVIRRSDRTAWQSFDQELVVLDVPSRTLLGLNPLGGWIWDNLDGTRSLAQIAELLADAYSQPLDRIQHDLLRFVEDLLARGCVEPAALEGG